MIPRARPAAGLLWGALALLAGSGPAAAGIIASTSFENEADLGSYRNTAAEGSALSIGAVVDITNSGPAVGDDGTVDSTAASTAAGDAGFDAVWVNTRDSVGLSDGDLVGVTTDTSVVGQFTDGSRGYVMEDTDGILRLTFDPVDLLAYANVDVSIDFFLRSAGYQLDDVFSVFADTDVGRITLIDTAGQDIDGLQIENEFLTLSADVPDEATTVRLVAEFDVDSAQQSLWLDNYRVTGDFVGTPEAVPEPGTLLLLGVAGLGGLAVRRARRRVRRA